MIRLAAIALMLVACSHETRVLLEVDGAATPNVTEVRLFIGRFVEDMVSIAPEKRNGQQPTFTGVLYQQDKLVDDRLELPAGGVITFGLTPPELADGGPSPDDRFLALAIGFAGDEPVAYAKAFDVEFNEGEIRIYELELRPADATKLRLWGPRPDDENCVVVADPDKSLFVIPSIGDIDCDGYGNEERLECNKEVHLGESGSIGLDNVSTQTDSEVSGPITVCRLATKPACKDGEMPDASPPTFNRPFCTSTALCDECPDEDTVFSCQTGSLRLHCSIPYLMDGGEPQLCGATIDVFPNNLATQNTCPGPAQFAVPGEQRWGDHIVFSNGVTATIATAGCVATITTQPGAGELVVAIPPVQAMIGIPINAPDAAGVVVPVDFAFELATMCPTETACAFAPGDVDQVQNLYRRCLDSEFPIANP